CHFVASAQTGLHENGRETWGQSIIVSHSGETLAELKDGVGYTLQTIDKKKQDTNRKDFPVLKHQKLHN
ncbi:MAG: carbon-nitrogen hydrolase family protein, partial [Kangiellaceae bacterium]